MKATDRSSFRNDIQALRGIAVLLVVFYHAGLPGLTAGYLGVDIFFVISGYLITGIIRRGLDEGSFSFHDFYLRRARRLLPAAYVVIALTLLTAPFFLSAHAIAELQSQVLGALTFTTNVVLWQQAGYFDLAAETKPLLHFWSLAIEEQYYLLMPLFLVVVPRRMWMAALIALLAMSLMLALVISPRFPDLSFYLLPTRWWELGLGSIGALVPLSALGARLIAFLRIPALVVLLAIPVWPTGLPHPGVDAALVCLAALAILLGRESGLAAAGSPLRLLAYVGNVSYSLYLVHWPVMVLTRSAYMGPAPEKARVIAVVLALLLAMLLYRLVEEPFRRTPVSASRWPIAGLVTASLMLAMVPQAMIATTGTDNWDYVRRTNYGIGKGCDAFDSSNRVDVDTCRTRAQSSILIQGDSYAMAWASALVPALADQGLAQATMSGCAPLLGVARIPREAGGGHRRDRAEKCLEFQKAALARAVADPSITTVILAARFRSVLGQNDIMVVETPEGHDERKSSLDLTVRGLTAMVDAYHRAGKTVVLLSSPPANGTDIGECLERRGRGQIVLDAPPDCTLSVKSVAAYQARDRALLAEVSRRTNVAVVSVYDFLCGNSLCVTTLEGVPLYRDKGHLSVDGAILIGRRSSLVKDLTAAVGGKQRVSRTW